jgi:hypothetical protein
MPRKPFKPYADRHPGGMIDIGTRAIDQRPELVVLVGKCLTAWPNIEAEMALLLGQLLGAPNTAALAVFQTLRRSSNQREAILEAGKASLSETDQNLLKAILNVHKSVETERNAGHLGVHSLMHDGILYMSTADYIAFKATLVLVGDRQYDAAKRERFNSSLSYYKAPDLEAIHRDIDALGWIWSEMIAYLQERAPETRAARFRALCERPPIARALENLRREEALPILLE